MNQNAEPLPAVQAISDLETLGIIVDSQRHRILSALIAEELGAAVLAERLKLPRTRIYYHLDLLERYGFVRVSGYRDGGTTMRLYLATAASFRIERGLFGDDRSSLNHTRATLLEAAAADIRGAREHEDRVLVLRQFLRLNPERRAALSTALTQLLDQYAQTDADGDDVEFISALFPIGEK
jgi:DNA-binding transcriptional ArsR family regulator